MITDKINKLRLLLEKENINLLEIKKILMFILTLKEIKDTNYFKSLINPVLYRNVRIPSKISPPSCTFQLSGAYTLTTNTKGCLLIAYNPYFLANENVIGKKFLVTYNNGTQKEFFISRFLSSCWYIDYNDLDGKHVLESDDVWYKALNINQTIPDIYTQYRLVSASIKVRYIDEIKWAAGVLGGAIVYDSDTCIGGFYSSVDRPDEQYNPNKRAYGLAVGSVKYSDFSIFGNAPIHGEFSCLDGIEIKYIPYSNSCFEYHKLYNKDATKGSQYTRSYYNPRLDIGPDYYQTGEFIFIYAQGLQPQTKLRIEIVSNFEALPNTEYLDYLPIDSPQDYTFNQASIINNFNDIIIQKINK